MLFSQRSYLWHNAALHCLAALNIKKVKVAIPALLGLLALAPSACPQDSDFTIIALPDTQYYSESYPDTFTAQTQWIVDHASALNIQMVLGLGDVVNDANQVSE